MNASLAALSPPDLERIWMRLVRFAGSRVGAQLLDAHTAEDMVSAVFTRMLLDEKTQFSSEEQVSKIAMRYIKSFSRDRRRRDKRMSGGLCEDNGITPFRAGCVEKAYQQVEHREQLGLLAKRLGTAVDIEHMCDCVSGGKESNQDLAEAMGCTVEDAVNFKKRAKRAWRGIECGNIR